MRLRAGSTAKNPDVAIRQIARGGPCGADWTRSNARHGYASASGNHARGLGAGYSAGRSACPWPRRSPRCVSLEAFPAIRPLTRLGWTRLRVDRWWSCYCWPARSPGTWVAAVSPTFGRLFEGTDEPSPGQTWPGPTCPLKHGESAGRSALPGRHRRGRRAEPAPRTLTNPIGMQQNCWQPHGKLLASAKVVLDLNGARQRSEDGRSTSCLDNLEGFSSARRSRAVSGRLWFAYGHLVHTCV